jgi:autotransporter passenger strand-loop-strand repeat protein
VSPTISGGGQQLIYGTASGTAVSSGAFEFVLSGGLASGTVVSSGGIARWSKAAGRGVPMSCTEAAPSTCWSAAP